MEKKFKGFSIPNFVQTPPEFFDLLIYDRDINCAEMRLLGFMIRATYGWQRKGYSLEFSLSDLQEYLGFGRTTATRTIKALMDRGYMERIKVEGTDRYKYRLVLSKEDEQQLDVSWDSTFNWKKVFEEPDKKPKLALVGQSQGDTRESHDDTSQSHVETTQSHDETTQSHDETTQSQDGTTQSHDETAQSHGETTQSPNETESGPVTIPGQSHDDTDIGTTVKPPESPQTQAGQGVGDSLKIVNKVEDIDNIDTYNNNKDRIIEEEEEDICASLCKQFFQVEVVNKLRLPQRVIDLIYEQLEWDTYTPAAFEKVCIKFRNGMKLGKININPIEWLKSTAANEEIIYYNEFTNVR
ncbi:hypothetical protein SAMN02799624_05352 [Paenibacillus sp. UNC496MF]|uniref:hypothetical protein n=1 Tax=Paenibacillus sp. UNC496MF TaxID=1502753 RepID=UPI0008E50FED|nr:hypothetical protein [Paenibacillus sp. UNC496MF]SFJ64605.1 hypothetical protein SAMN02799624_05352 [Paenibacillus sp. UNC496MF]